MNSNSTRLNKYISESGLCSRREADRFIEQGVVFINGTRAKMGRQVFKGDRVMVNGQAIVPKQADEAIYIAFNKPVGIVSTTEAGVRDNIVNYINHSQRIFPIGRLDKESQGLIFLTSNGDIVNKILRAGNKHEKEYLVTVNKAITDDFIEGMAKGVPMLGTTTKRCLVKKEAAFIFRIVLVQGLNRQIRRMCEYFGYEVTKLERTRIMHISLKGIPPGEWREFTKSEMETLTEMIKESAGEEEGGEAKTTKAKPTRASDGHNGEKTFEKKNPPLSKKSYSKSSGPRKGKSKNTGSAGFSKKSSPRSNKKRSSRR